MDNIKAQTRYANNVSQTDDGVSFKNLHNIANSYRSLTLENDKFIDINQSSSLLNFDNFKFDIPENATIKGIIVTIKRSGLGIKDDMLKININGSSNLAKSGDWADTDYSNYGSVGYLWETNPMPKDINNNRFGIQYSCRGFDKNPATPILNYAAITVYYTISTYTMKSSIINDERNIYMLVINKKDNEEFDNINISIKSNIKPEKTLPKNGIFENNIWTISEFMNNKAILYILFKDQKYNITAIIKETGQKDIISGGN